MEALALLLRCLVGKLLSTYLGFLLLALFEPALYKLGN